ncbi:MAG TPA: helix-turn-helix domain-containing protein, partial [Ilumatobacter sp.]|nr:helix-turn-helix domain-containing protein [Ilumatobacter sp.]
MAEDVKRSSSGNGQARTRFARRAVIDAARTLFIEGGYATTTISAISRAADVPEPTVYRLFSSKLGILKMVLDVSIAGDDEPAAVHERPNVASLFDEADPRKVLAGFVAVATQINQRTSAMYSVLSRAADSDADAAALFSTLRRQRGRGQEQIVDALH